MGTCVRTSRSIVPTLLVLLVLLTGCTENANLFTSLDEVEGPSLKTVVSGSVVSPLTPLSIQLAYPDEDVSRATSMTVELRDPDGGLVAELAFTEEQLLAPTLPEIELPQPDPGPYLLVVEAMRGEELLFNDERQIFVLSASPRIRSVSVYPSSVGSEAEAVAVADIIPAADTNPYLKWYYQEQPIGEGYQANGGAKTVFSPKGGIGVHRVSVDLYPWGPDEGVRVTDRTTITAGTDVFVRSEPQAAAGSDGALLVYPLNGRLEPSVDLLTREFSAVRRAGGVVLDVERERLGYRIPSGGAISIPYDVVPPEGEAVRLTLRTSLAGLQGLQTGLQAVVPSEVVLTLGRLESPLVELRLGSDGDGIVETYLEPRRNFDRVFTDPVQSDPGWVSVSLVLISQNGDLYAVPEISGRVPRVFRASDSSSLAGPSQVSLGLEGGGDTGFLVEHIEMVPLPRANEYFTGDFTSFLYYNGRQGKEPSFRAGLIDLDRENAVVLVPEGHFSLWYSTDGVSRFLLRREGDTLSVLDPGPQAQPGRVLPNVYPLRASGRVPAGTVVVRRGDAFNVEEDGVVSVPDGLSAQMIVVLGATTGGTGPAFLATELR